MVPFGRQKNLKSCSEGLPAVNPMSNLKRRLLKLEARLTDSSGLVPHSQAWRDYWFPKVDRILSGQEPSTPGCIPLEVAHAIIVAGIGEPEGMTVGIGDMTAQTKGQHDEEEHGCRCTVCRY